MDVIFLIGGIALLYLGGNFLVKGSVSLANHFKVSPFVIGIVIISLGTSFPELIVSVEAAIKNHPDISLGNVVGSNIANIALALGITALILPIIVRKKSIWIDWLVLFGVSVIIIFCGFVFGELSWFCGLILLILLIAYYFYLIVDARKNRKKIKIEKAKYSIIVSIIIITLSFVALAVGAKGVIEGGSNIAKTMGISERVISLIFNLYLKHQSYTDSNKVLTLEIYYHRKLIMKVPLI
jgi:cation:H+ antiporter